MTSEDPPPAEADGLPEDLMLAPRLVRVDQRLDVSGGKVILISHLELWPWRVIVRGTERRDPSPAPEQPQPGARLAIDAVEAEVARRTAISAMRFFEDWGLVDDEGTNFFRAGSSQGPISALWSDFSIEFWPAAPTVARHLRLTISDVGSIDVQLGE